MRSILLLSLVILSQTVFGQDHAGQSFKLYIGSKLKIKPIQDADKNTFLMGFILDYSKDTEQWGKEDKKNTPFYHKLSGYSSYQSLKNIEFNCTDAFRNRKYGVYLLKLEHESVGTIYYKYQVSTPKNFVFEVVGGLNFNHESICEDITEEKDKFSDKISWTSRQGQITFSKVKKEGIEITLMTALAHSSIVEVGKKGLIILFSDGDKIEFNDAEVKTTTSSSSGFRYICSVAIDEDQIKTISEKRITDYKVGPFESGISEFRGNIFRAYLKCIISK